MSARNTRDSRRPRTRIEHLEGESAEFKTGLSVDRVLPSKSTLAYSDNAIVFVNDANSTTDNEDVGFLIDDNRLFTKRQRLQTDGDKLVIHASANLALEDNYAITEKLKVDFVEPMDAGKITFNDTLGAAAIEFDVIAVIVIGYVDDVIAAGDEFERHTGIDVGRERQLVILRRGDDGRRDE